MPLLDHFHPPLSLRHRWESFHTYWAVAMAGQLNRELPAGRYFVEVQSHVGSRVEADVAEYESPEGAAANGNSGGVAVQTYSPPAATMVLPAVFPDDIEVQILDSRDGARLVGVVELVSPANKDRPETRDGFAAKCLAYLQRGIGLVVVDVVTERTPNLHNEMVRRQGLGEAFQLAGDVLLYAAAYRPLHRDGRNETDVWAAPLAVGQSLPTLPLALRGGPCVPLDLEATYTEARGQSRL